MSTIKPHRHRTRHPESKAAARRRRAERQAAERVATAAERAFLALIEGGK